MGKKFANDLENLGDFEVLLDQNMPKGFPLTRFMEKGMTSADKVLVIGTPMYKSKAESGKGVAFEESIISTELLHDIDTIKYFQYYVPEPLKHLFLLLLNEKVESEPYLLSKIVQNSKYVR